MTYDFVSAQRPAKGTLVLLVHGENTLGGLAGKLDDLTGGQLSRAIASGPFAGKLGQQLGIASPLNSELGRVILVGVGRPEPLKYHELEKLGQRIHEHISRVRRGVVSIGTDVVEAKGFSSAAVARIALGLDVADYRFDKYKTGGNSDDDAERRIQFCCADPEGAAEAFESLKGLAEGLAVAKDLVAEPPNVLTPTEFARRTRESAPSGLEISVLGEDQLQALGMNAFLSVGRGSPEESQLVVAKWMGAGNDAPVSSCLIGKGVTFDAGGLAIKPTNQMQSMKKDMAGAAAVWGALIALARRKAPVNLVGILCLAENMPSGTATKPGDVVTSLSGQTIEILDPDAEGRLLIADAVTYARQEFSPGAIIDVATLTGSIVRALGGQYAGLFCNDDVLADKLVTAGLDTNDLVWRMPLGPGYDKQINSDIADMKNIGGRDAGAITAAQFIRRFAGDTPWAHLDIAGVAWAEKDQGAAKSGPTGFGVRLLDRFATALTE